MKRYLFVIGLLLNLILSAQPNTEVYLAEINSVDGKTTLKNPINISNNEGYDNQPSFYDDNTVLFSSTRNGQTDIAKYDISSGKISWLTDTPAGSEYSPLRIPGSNDISAIRLDTTGLQRLYRYDSNDGSSEKIRKDAKVGYHVWHSKDILVNTVLVENGMDLIVSNFIDQTDTAIQKGVGRSLHTIPDSELVSFISREKDGNKIKSLNPITRETKTVSNIPKNSQDMSWLGDGSILVSAGKLIYKLTPESKENPEIIDLSGNEQIHVITRMAVSPNGKYLAIVSEESPAKIVQKQVDSYNSGDLDAFVNCYSKDVTVAKFPADTLYVGHEKMRKNYSSLSPENKVWDVEVVKRTVIGNKVIDQEKVTGNGKVQMQVAIYEVNNNSIDSMTFIFDDDSPDPENIVSEQLVAYNNRDIDAFLKTYTDDVQLFNFPLETRSKGQEAMRKGYAGFFESTPDLHCEIKNRMVIANIVIDEEYITANGNNFSAVAIYEVENDKIAKVTFLR